MAVNFYDLLSPFDPGVTGWRNIIGHTVSDWQSGEFTYDFYSDITVDTLVGVPTAPGAATTYLVAARVIVDCRTEFDPAPVAYDGLSNKYKFGEAALFDTDVYAQPTYLNFYRQFIGRCVFYTPNVTRGDYGASLPIFPLQSDQIVYPGTFSGSVGVDPGLPIFSNCRVRVYDGVEARVHAYYRALYNRTTISATQTPPVWVFYP